jgi:methylglyoxal synthase
MVLQDLGGVIFFTDPLFSHPHAADIATLLRMCDLHNIVHASNPTTAEALIPVLRDGADGAERHGQKGVLSCSMPAPCSLYTPLTLPGLTHLALGTLFPYNGGGTVCTVQFAHLHSHSRRNM